MANYNPFIIYEVGTNKDLAKSYGVSERTIYRWKQRANKEAGIKMPKQRRPRLSTLQKFKGTRKQLANKYGVSERTAYRWLAKARAQGAEIESRQKTTQYIGVGILDEKGTNKQLADKYNVSERTIARWKRRARSEIASPFGKQVNPENFIDEFKKGVFYNPLEDFETEIEQTEFDNVFTQEEPLFEVEEFKISDKMRSQLSDISILLTDFELINKKSKFHGLTEDEKIMYLHAYIKFQWEENPYQFNQSPPEGDYPKLNDPEAIANVNIWGDEFNIWLDNQLLIDKG